MANRRVLRYFSTESATPLEASPAKPESRIAPTPNVFGNCLHAADEAPGSVTVILFDALNTPFMEQAYVRDACLGCCGA
jgi:hypothetical protein